MNKNSLEEQFKLEDLMWLQREKDRHKRDLEREYLQWKAYRNQNSSEEK
jgi:hypothetical protein